MNSYFVKFLDNLELTSVQKGEARTKYTGVCKTVHTYFYDSEYTGDTKLLFGSYRKVTNIRPITSDQDVDVLIKLPYSIYEQYDAHESNGQSNLIQKIKDILKDSYTTTDTIKGWGKVILVEFRDGAHNVELLPAFENSDGTFTIPNSENGGSWENFDPRNELKKFFDSNQKTGGLTRELSKMIKRWLRVTSGLRIKAYKLEEYVIQFLEFYDYKDKDYPILIYKFYEYLLTFVDQANRSYVQTALVRSKKALDFFEEEKVEKSIDEWQKIFGSQFPSFVKQYTEIEKSSIAPKEQFIENIVPVTINPLYRLKLDCEIQMNGFLRDTLSNFIQRGSRLPRKKNLTFRIEQVNVPLPYSVKWKVRNYGQEAQDSDDLRGEITDGGMTKVEGTKYRGEHFIECYIIKDGNCVAIQKLDVPII